MGGEEKRSGGFLKPSPLKGCTLFVKSWAAFAKSNPQGGEKERLLFYVEWYPKVPGRTGFPSGVHEGMGGGRAGTSEGLQATSRRLHGGGGQLEPLMAVGEEEKHRRRRTKAPEGR